jgi:carboxyl-terminal processing protease
MRYITRYTLILLLGVFIGAGITLERAVLAERHDSSGALPLEELRAFTEVYSKIKSDYVEDVDDKKLLEDAITGMLAGLDPHSSYLDPQGFKEVRIGTEGEFGGLGIEVTMENGFIKVVSPIEDTPAARAGIEPGDLIVRLDDKAVKGLTLSDAVKLMRGKPGSVITLTVIREGEAKPLKVDITRAIIKIQSVKSRILEPGYGYLRITQFQANTGQNLKTALRKLETENKGKLKGMVLDLRNNPGVGKRWVRVGIGNRRRCFTGSRSGHHHGHQNLWQGFGADHYANEQRRRPQIDDGALLHPEREIYPSHRHRTRHHHRRCKGDQERTR